MKIAVFGTQFGDEGKSKVVRYFLGANYNLDGGRYDVTARYQGGANAGHTQWFGYKRIIMHHVPSGITMPGVYNADLAGTLIKPDYLATEIDEIEEAGFPVTPDNFGISGRAQVTLTYHTELEKMMEEARGDDRIETTGKAIGPTVMTHAGREGVLFAEFVGDDFPAILGGVVTHINSIFGTGFDAARIADQCAGARDRLGKYLIDEAGLLFERGGDNWLLEGAQAVGLDINYGTYPYTTSTSPVRIYPRPDRIYGVAKAFQTRVGEGPIPTFIDNPTIQDKLRAGRDTRTSEHGATTGRPRECCWFDSVQVKYASVVGGADALVLTKVDELAGLPTIRICRAYRIDGVERPFPPQNRTEWNKIEPVYDELPGWPEDALNGVTECTEYGQLHGNVQRFVDRIEELTDTPVELISFGPEMEKTIIKTA